MIQPAYKVMFEPEMMNFRFIPSVYNYISQVHVNFLQERWTISGFLSNGQLQTIQEYFFIFFTREHKLTLFSSHLKPILCFLSSKAGRPNTTGKKTWQIFIILF